eukprot:9367899-Alexandrium_andersonii.AAC.1
MLRSTRAATGSCSSASGAGRETMTGEARHPSMQLRLAPKVCLPSADARCSESATAQLRGPRSAASRPGRLSP